MSAAPWRTRSPERTLIFVIQPSTCGLIAAERRDFRVAKYSEESGMSTSCAICVFTGIAEKAGALAACCCVQPIIAPAQRNVASIASERGAKKFKVAEELASGMSVLAAFSIKR